MANPDRRTALLAAYENAAVIVSGVAAEELGHPTPCPGYDVAGLIDHLVEAARRSAAAGWGQAPPPGDESPHVELSEAPDLIHSEADHAAEGWADESRLPSTFTMPWGEVYTGSTLVDMYVAELAAHAWDLARATGQIDKLSASLALPALEGARAMIKPAYRNMLAPGVPFGAEVTPPADADDWERLAAFMGRQPRAPLDRGSTPPPSSTAPPPAEHKDGRHITQRRGRTGSDRPTPRSTPMASRQCCSKASTRSTLPSTTSCRFHLMLRST